MRKQGHKKETPEKRPHSDSVRRQPRREASAEN